MAEEEEEEKEEKDRRSNRRVERKVQEATAAPTSNININNNNSNTSPRCTGLLVCVSERLSHCVSRGASAGDCRERGSEPKPPELRQTGEI